jgi:hypothetical protein
MNVTLKLPDDLCRQARHRAVDASQSLSQWMADLVQRELTTAPPSAPRKPLTWMDAFSGDPGDPFLDRDLPVADRKDMRARRINLRG